MPQNSTHFCHGCRLHICNRTSKVLPLHLLFSDAPDRSPVADLHIDLEISSTRGLIQPETSATDTMFAGYDSPDWIIQWHNFAHLHIQSPHAHATFLPTISSWEIIDTLFHEVPAFLLSQQRQLVMHAAGLADKDGRGILILGDSGAGKSTTTALLLSTEHFKILGDDLLLISGNGHIHPATPFIRLWPQPSLEQHLCRQNANLLASLPPKQLWHIPHQLTASHPCQLHTIWILTPIIDAPNSDLRPKVLTVHTADAILQLLQQTFVACFSRHIGRDLIPPSSQDFLLTRLQTMIQHVCIQRLIFPHHWLQEQPSLLLDFLTSHLPS